jgi:hypothetical protein
MIPLVSSFLAFAAMIAAKNRQNHFDLVGRACKNYYKLLKVRMGIAPHADTVGIPLS